MNKFEYVHGAGVLYKEGDGAGALYARVLGPPCRYVFLVQGTGTPLNRMTERRERKHYLPATSLEGDKMEIGMYQKQSVHQMHVIYQTIN